MRFICDEFSFFFFFVSFHFFQLVVVVVVVVLDALLNIHANQEQYITTITTTTAK